MTTHKVVEWVDIHAPRDEVFELLLNLKRRMQLSPLWGVASIEAISADYPGEGSHYHVRMVKGEAVQYDTFITTLAPSRKFAYRLTSEQQANVTWILSDCSSGTRVTYEEEFTVEDAQGADFTQSVRDVVRQWLRNIKNYTELRDGRLKRFVRWLVDHYFLELRTDQRRTVVMILVMHAIGFISFVMAAIAMGFASLVM